LVLAAAVAGSLTIATTAVGAAATLNGNVKYIFLYESIYVMAIEKFLYLSLLGWLLQEYDSWMGHMFQVWKFHLKISPWEEKPHLLRAYGPWEANFSCRGLIFGGEEISIPETQPIQKSYISVSSFLSYFVKTHAFVQCFFFAFFVFSAFILFFGFVS
jgi:hypothetical protein